MDKCKISQDKNRRENNNTPVAAPGNYDFLEEKATPEEKKKGDYTRVTRLALDEVDPS